jgi:ribosomal protein S18 acetylase RimI-like enzyme
MLPLSNSTRSADFLAARPAQGAEITTAVAILLAGEPSRAPQDQIQTFLTMAAQRGLNLNDLWVAVDGQGVRWAMLPVVSPGRTMLLLSPPYLPKDVPDAALAAVLDGACTFHGEQGVHLAQLLIDPAEKTLRQAYVRHGFLDLAELIYLQREVRKINPLPPLPPSIQVMNYSAQTHDLFIQTIARSYEMSLDCPGLSGLRDMEDVVAGHKGIEFDPAIWFLLTVDQVPSGVLLMGTATHANALELVYLGLVPEARGKGFGDVLMNLALLMVIRNNRSDLTLAVDSRNAPAMKLYFRHGLRRVGSRAALIRQIGP